ncbi:MAG: hemerythrin family protein [Nitrospinae bacterium]|nr:hemerythrin family protein [Nitrospinota bacterium]
MFTEWNESHSVGVKRFDEQHKRLFDIINELHRGITRGEGRENTSAILRKLVAYVTEHFADEERLMERYAFPALASHTAEHNRMREIILGFLGKFDQADARMGEQMLSALTEWINSHVGGADKQYGHFFNQRGVY